MSTTPPVQVPDAAIDTLGISALTTRRSLADGRLGQSYDPARWAAAAPIHYHPIANGNFVEIASRRWYSATPSSGDPGVYSAHTESLLPSWRVLAIPTGTTISITPDFTVPMTTPSTTRTVIAGASKSGFLFLLNSVVLSGVRSAVVQLFRVDSQYRVPTVAVEEVVPSFGSVIFDRGCYLTDQYLYVFGADASGVVYLARKIATRIGTTRIIKARGSGQNLRPSTMDPSWEFQTATGFLQDSTQAAPVQAVAGDLVTAGPIGASRYLDRVLIASVSVTGGAYTAHVQQSRGLHDPWHQISTVDLGSTGYAGGTVQFMPTLPPKVIGAQAKASTPYVVTQIGTGFMAPVWGTWAVPVQS